MWHSKQPIRQPGEGWKRRKRALTIVCGPMKASEEKVRGREGERKGGRGRRKRKVGWRGGEREILVM